jgi:hypothetical protein
VLESFVHTVVVPTALTGTENEPVADDRITIARARLALQRELGQSLELRTAYST